jgi:hypothetical protein
MNNLENKISEKYDNNSYLDINNGFVNMQVENIV